MHVHRIDLRVLPLQNFHGPFNETLASLLFPPLFLSCHISLTAFNLCQCCSSVSMCIHCKHLLALRHHNHTHMRANVRARTNTPSLSGLKIRQPCSLIGKGEVCYTAGTQLHQNDAVLWKKKRNWIWSNFSCSVTSLVKVLPAACQFHSFYFLFHTSCLFSIGFS